VTTRSAIGRVPLTGGLWPVDPACRSLYLVAEFKCGCVFLLGLNCNYCTTKLSKSTNAARFRRVVTMTDGYPALPTSAGRLVALLAVAAVLAVNEVLARLVLAALLVSFLHHGDVALAPVDDEGLSDEEEHDADLREGEEAPDRGLLHEIVADEGGHDGAEEEQEDALNDHALFLVQSEERGEHQEGVNASTHDVVRGVGHGHGPSQVGHALGLEGAQLVTAQPLRGLVVAHVHGVEGRDVRQEVSSEEEESTDQAQTLDDVIAILVLAALGERCVDHVAIVRLQAYVQEAKQSEHLVDDVVTVRVREASRKEEILDGLEELHGEEEEHTCAQKKKEPIRTYSLHDRCMSHVW